MHQIAVDVAEEDRAALVDQLRDQPTARASGNSGGGLALDPEQLKLIVDGVESLATIVSTLVTTWLAVRAVRATREQPAVAPPRVVLELATRDVEIAIVDGKPALPDDLPVSAREMLRISLI